MRSDHFITVDNFSMCVHCVRHFIETASAKQALDHDRHQGNIPGKGGSKRERVPSPTRGLSKSPKTDSGEKSGANSLTYGTASLRLLTHHTSTSPPSSQVISHIPDPALGPILIPAAPPYSHSQSSGMESEQSNNSQLPVHISSVRNL